MSCLAAKKDVLFSCESTNSRTVRPLNASSFSQNCVSVSVERVDKDKDADESVGADRAGTEETCEWTTTWLVHSARGNRH